MRWVAGAIGLFLVVLGFWAFFAPESFYERIAAFPEYNRHFLHDAGAFQVGLGAVLLFALVWTDALLVALAGVAVGALLHFWAHVVDRDLGGRAGDPLSLGVIALVLVVAAVWRAREVGTKT